MYELWGGGAPFSVVSDDVLVDCKGQRVRLLGAVASVLHELQSDGDTVVSWVSCTDEPAWADECLRKLKTAGGVPLHGLVPPSASMIFKANKQRHFEKLKVAYPHIGFEEMLFFDNEKHNIDNVQKLGVKCIYCPEGLSRESWQRGLSLFQP